MGYSKSNTSPILKLFLSRLDELVGPYQKDTLWSEDFEHGRLYGRVKVIDPFRAA